MVMKCSALCGRGWPAGCSPAPAGCVAGCLSTLAAGRGAGARSSRERCSNGFGTAWSEMLFFCLLLQGKPVGRGEVVFLQGFLRELNPGLA